MRRRLRTAKSLWKSSACPSYVKTRSSGVKTRGYSADNMVYMVSAGGKDICRVTLDEMTENGDAGFGFTYLQVTRVELLASFTAPEAHEITITIPAGATVSVNGVALTEEYVKHAI